MNEPYRRTCLDPATADENDIAQSLLEVAHLELAGGDLGEALRWTRQSVKIRRHALPPQHPDLLPSLTQLGGILTRQAHYGEAISVLREVVQARKSQPQMDTRQLVSAITSLGIALMRSGDFQAAESNLRQTWTMVQEHNIDDGELLVGVRNGLGTLLVHRSQFDEARKHLDDVLAIEEKRLGVESPALLFVLRNLGLLHHRAGRFDEARKAYLRALELWKPVRLEQGDLDEAVVHARLGELLLQQGRLDAAKPLLLSALQAREQSLERDHPFLVASLRTHTKLLRAQGNTDAAVRYEARLKARAQ